MKLAMRAKAFSKKVTLFSTAFILAVSSLTAVVPFVLSSDVAAAGGVQVSTEQQLRDALADGETEINLTGAITTTSQVKVDYSTTLNGGALVANFAGQGYGKDAVLLVVGADTHFKAASLTVDANKNTGLQGIQVAEGASASLLDPVIINSTKSGLHVNGATAIVNNLTTRDNGGASWGGVSVSHAGAVTISGESYHSNERVDLRKDILSGGGTITDVNKQYNSIATLFYTLKAAPAAPVIATPLQNAVVANSAVTINWNKPPYAHHFEYSIDGGAAIETNDQSVTATLINGSHTVKVRSVAQSGLAGSWSAERVFTVKEAPTVTIDEDAIVIANGKVTLSGEAHANDARGLNRVYLQLVERSTSSRCGGVTLNLIGRGNDVNWQHSYTLTDIETVSNTPVSCSDGNYAAHIAAVDMSNLSGSYGWTENFALDTTVPTVSKVIVNGTTIEGQYQRNANCAPINQLLPVSGKVNLTAVAGDANGVASVTYSIRKLLDNGCTDTAAYRSSTITLQQSSENLSNWSQPSGAVLDTQVDNLNGKYAIVLVTKDTSGNQTVRYIDMDIDNTKPVLKVSLDRSGYLDNGGVTRKVAVPEIEAYDANLAEIKITDANDNEVTRWDDVTPGATTYKGIGWLGEGTYKAYAYDKTGNVSDVFTFTIDNTKPVTGASLSNNTVVSNNTLPTLTVNATDANGIDYTQYRIQSADGSKIAGYGWVPISNSGVVELPEIAGLADGAYRVNVRTFDNAGNKTNTLIEFTIDRSITSTVRVSSYTSLTPELSGVAQYSDDSLAANVDLVVTVDGTDEYEVTTDAFGVWSVDVVVTGSEAGVSHTVAVALKGSDPTATPAGTTTFTTTLQSQIQRGATNTQGAAAREATQPQLPSVTGPAGQPGAAALGAGDEAGKESALGASTEKTLADAVDANNTDGKALGLAWYWWILIVATLATIVWWIVAAVRKRSAES